MGDWEATGTGRAVRGWAELVRSTGKDVAVGTRPREGNRWRHTGFFSGSLGKRDGTEAGNTCWGWGGAQPHSAPRALSAYLVPPTLGVHEHQQGLHEGRRSGPDDEGSPAALLGVQREPVRPFPVPMDPAPLFSSALSHASPKSGLRVGLVIERQLGLDLPPSLGPKS